MVKATSMFLLSCNWPSYLFVTPWRSIGTAILQSLQHQQVTLTIAEQEVSISPTGGIQQALDSLEHMQPVSRGKNKSSSKSYAYYISKSYHQKTREKKNLVIALTS